MSAGKALETFKKPSSPSKRKRKILSEEKFAETLENIIQRECFPDLEKLKAQNAYLDAVANNDVQMMRELVNKYGGFRNTPTLRREGKETPSTFETPSSINLSARTVDADDGITTPIPGTSVTDEPTKLPAQDSDNESVASGFSTRTSTGGRKLKDLGLDEFLNQYTSEDNQSFQDFVQEGLRKHKVKYPWLYGEDDSGQESTQIKAISEADRLMIDDRPNKIETWKYTSINPLMNVPEGAPLTGAEVADAIRRKPEVDFHRTRFCRKPFNADSLKSPAPSTSSNLIQGLSEGKIGLDGKEMKTNETPTVNGFKLVRTPSPNPEGDESPFLTWGEIEGTPFRLDASDTPISSVVGTPYRMMGTSRREQLALELAEKNSKRHREKKDKGLEIARSYLVSPSPRPKTSMQRMHSMSPAAQRLTRTLMKRNEPGTPRTPYTPSK